MSRLRLVKGNTFYTKNEIRAYRYDGTEIEDFSLTQCKNIKVIANKVHSREIINNYNILDDHTLRIQWVGSKLQLGPYRLEITGKYKEADFRYFSEEPIFDIVNSADDQEIPADSIIESDYYIIRGSKQYIDLPNVTIQGIQSDWKETNVSSPSYIKNKPNITIPTALSEFTNNVGFITRYDLPEVDLSGYVKESSLATVATTGNYDDLNGRPTIPSLIGYATEQYVTDKIELAKTTEDIVSGWGFTKNVGTITGITMNGASKGTSGVVDLGTVLTSFTETDPVFAASAAAGISSSDITTWNNKQNKITASQKIGSLYRNNVSGSGGITITGTTGQFPRVTNAGTYTVIVNMNSSTQNYGLTVSFGGSNYTLTATNGVIEDSRQVTVPANATWSAAVVGSVNSNTVLSVEIWNSTEEVTTLHKVAVTGSYEDLEDKPTIPTIPNKVSAFTNDAGYLTSESDPTVPTWAKSSIKPTYTAAEVGALPDNTVIPNSVSDLTQDVNYAGSTSVAGTANKTASIPYGEVDSTSTATAFTATVNGITELRDGICMMLKNGVVTSASGFTININGLGAKPCYSNMATGNDVTPTNPARDTTIFNINYTMLFVYSSTIDDEGGWICYRGYDANTNTLGYQIRTNSSTLPVSDQTGRYRLLFTSADGQKYVPANTTSSTNATSARAVNQRPIDPHGDIVYYGYTTVLAANKSVGAAYQFQQIALGLGYSFNPTGATLTLSHPDPVYVKCTPQADGSAIIDPDTPYVQSLPTTDDGKIYIFLGRAYSATNIELTLNHPIYYYKDGAIRRWLGPV